ncbi:MAG: hypothetical protein IH628_17335 [Proteobacteria bacterium]|nr:hypothetical protein [Pseudomonadota bacterium]
MKRASPGECGALNGKQTCTVIIFLLLCVMGASNSFAEGSLTASGQISLRGTDARDDNSIKEDPSLTGRLKLDAIGSSWRFYSWLEGGWDGTVRRPPQDSSLFKNYDEVYQSNSPFLEFKDLTLSHSSSELDLRMGIQRFAWGRLDEYPPNDLLNPWDYTRFLAKSLEDRKIGVPSLSATLSRSAWSFDAVWVPWLVPYRFPLPNERWFGATAASALARADTVEITPREPDLPSRTIGNGNIGVRARHAGDIEWAINLYHGYDPKPVFKTTTLAIARKDGKFAIDPGYVPDFHRITSIGLDGAGVTGDWSIRAEAMYSINRHFNIRQELWGYPLLPLPGTYPLKPNEVESDSLSYGIGADYRLFEDGLLTMQVQQTLILDRPETLYERKLETILWVNLKAGFMNRKVETNIAFACNPEHGDNMAKANVWYIFTDSWKAGISGIAFTGPSQSTFGRYADNDEVGAELVYSW